MINREMMTAKLLTYNDSLDEYGQPRKTAPTETSIDVTRPKLYKHSPVEDVRFNDITDTCLTFSKEISDANELKVDSNTYFIKFVNPEGRLAQLFLVAK